MFTGSLQNKLEGSDDVEVVEWQDLARWLMLAFFSVQV